MVSRILLANVMPATLPCPIPAASERLTPALSATFGDIEKAASTSDVMNLTPTQADLLKTQLQRESRMLYAQRGAPNGPKAIGDVGHASQNDIDALFD